MTDGCSASDETAPAPSGDFGANDRFDVLTSERRRRVLSYFRDADDAVAELTELADWVSARETDPEGDQFETVAAALHHVHLPKLADVGVLDYDPRSATVRYRSRSETGRATAFADEQTGGRL